MAHQTQTDKNQNAPRSGSDPSGADKSSVTSQGGKPGEMAGRGQSDASKGDTFDRKPATAGGPDAMKNEGGNQPSSDMRNKGMRDDAKGPNEQAPSESQRN